MTDKPTTDINRLAQKCVYYNGNAKCAFYGQEECVWENGMVEFPYFCGVESRMEEQAMFGED